MTVAQRKQEEGLAMANEKQATTESARMRRLLKEYREARSAVLLQSVNGSSMLPNEESKNRLRRAALVLAEATYLAKTSA